MDGNVSELSLKHHGKQMCLDSVFDMADSIMLQTQSGMGNEHELSSLVVIVPFPI